MSLLELKFEYVIDNYILLQILPSPSPIIIDESNLIIEHEYTLDNIYTVKLIDSTLNKYKIEFEKNINVLDALKLYIKENNEILSNSLYINMCKVPKNNMILLPLTHQYTSSGTYSVSCTSINELPLDDKSTSYVYCNGIDINKSDIKTTKSSYVTNELLGLIVNLFDNNTLSVPNGKYNVNIKVERQ